MARLNRRSCAVISSIFLLTSFPVGSQSPTSTPAPPAETPSPQQTVPSASETPSPQPALTAQPQGQKQPVYESAAVLKATTRLVLVDVVVTDHKDRAVTDLKREDFIVLEDGREQPISAFSLQQPPASSVPAPTVANEAKLPDNVFTNSPRYKPGSALNVVLLDALNTTYPHQAYARQQMIKFLEKLPAGRPVAVYTLGGKLTLVQDFTTDPAALKEVMKKVKNGISPLLDNPTGDADTQILPTDAVDSGLVSQGQLMAIMQFEQERVAFQTDIRVRYTLDALSAIARSLSGYPGRKNLIWISEAIPFNIDPNMELTGGDIFAGTRNYAADIAATADQLIDAQVAIYPIDARTLEGYSVFNASNPGVDKFGRSYGRNPTRMGNAINAEQAEIQNAHATMQDMAQRTGGKAFYNRNDIDSAIDKSMDDGSTYYTLAYYPENKDWNGKYRKLQIKVNRAGLKLRNRQGYYAVDPKVIAESNQKGEIRQFAEALSLDSPSSTELRFWAGVVPPSGKVPDVYVNFLVDANAVSFEHMADGRQHAEVDCVVQAYKKGKLIKTEAGTSKAFLSPENYEKIRKEGFPCQRPINLPPGTYFLRLAVRDDHNGLFGTTTAHATVPAPIVGSAQQAGDSAPKPEAAPKPEDKDKNK